MTATTPDDDQHEDRALDNAYARLEDASRALAAVTAERDQAVRGLNEQKRVNTSNLRTMTEQLDQARQMLAEQSVLEVHHHDVEAHAASFNEGWDEAVKQGLAAPRGEVEKLRQMLENAPHGTGCQSWSAGPFSGPKCNCWKAGL